SQYRIILMTQLPLTSTPFPYTTLFRSVIFVSHAIDNGRVRLQSHTFMQTPYKHARNLLTLVGHPGLTLNNRGHDQRFIGCIVRQAFSAISPLFLKHAHHATVGALEYIQVRFTTTEHVGIWKEPAFRVLATGPYRIHHLLVS